jgi:lipoic acid synthetase
MQDSLPKPVWLKTRLPRTETYKHVRDVVSGLGLHTVCSSAHCPNTAECWDSGSCTFMILGDTCTRACRFCAVSHSKAGKPIDTTEPWKLATAAKMLNLDYIVLTSVDRDDLGDGGAGHYANCIRMLREERPTAKVEAIIPDFSARLDSLGTIIMAAPDVVAHNVEVVKRLTPSIRDRRASYEQSLGVLSYVKMMSPHTITKTSLMLGLGESRDEIKEAIVDIREAGVDILTLGQYLRPGEGQAPVERYVSPHEFERLGDFAKSLGFGYVAAGPFVRSSYHAADYFAFISERREEG